MNKRKKESENENTKVRKTYRKHENKSRTGKRERQCEEKGEREAEVWDGRKGIVEKEEEKEEGSKRRLVKTERGSEKGEGLVTWEEEGKGRRNGGEY